MSQENASIMNVQFHCESFTSVSNHCLEDTTLPCDARGMLITMISLRHDWHYSVDGLMSLVPDGECKIRRILNDLEEHGYLYRERYRDKKGHFQFIYHIYDESQKYHDDFSGKNPSNQARKSKVGNAEKVLFNTGKNKRSQPALSTSENPHVESANEEEPTVEDEALLNTNKYKTDINILTSINQPEENESGATAPSNERNVDAIDMMDRKSEIREELSDRLNYDRLIAEYPKQKKLIDAIFRTMTEKLAHKEMEPIKISGCTYSYEELEEAFNELEYEHIVYVITCISQSGRAIKNPQNYILRCLLQANTRDIYEASRAERSGKNTFTQFEQNTYNFDELEELLLDN